MALVVRCARTVAGAVALSGFVAPGLVAGDEALAQIRPPVLWGYDPADPVVGTPATDRFRSFLREHVELDERRYPGVGHGISAPELADVAAFLDRLLPRDAAPGVGQDGNDPHAR